ncbi:G-type lectin S-receptor-like serine/threonine-protein kinase At1g11410 [Eucalyptus grandis]|uniref:G-type lectin S-receptor-like serine/threonine-protein kinase At1g11410 n=1 Tax=Eucalyptus grandis TaxID=71139 RepID=UPI00192EF918|nr:G-type lectin S-receptor-like serine/threonine-protein kinase At1g11410 [Eucalyptus grandis]
MKKSQAWTVDVEVAASWHIFHWGTLRCSCFDGYEANAISLLSCLKHNEAASPCKYSMITRTVSLHILVLFLLLHSTDSSDTLAPNNTLKDGDVLISQGRKFVSVSSAQSFDYPTDTYLPSMKLGLDRRTGLNRFVTSWKSEDDPAPGSCSYRFEPTGYPQYFLYKGQDPYWRGGAIIEKKQGSFPEMANDFVYNITITINAMEVSLMYGVANASVISRYVAYESGSLKHF